MPWQNWTSSYSRNCVDEKYKTKLMTEVSTDVVDFNHIFSNSSRGHLDVWNTLTVLPQICFPNEDLLLRCHSKTMSNWIPSTPTRTCRDVLFFLLQGQTEHLCNNLQNQHLADICSVPPPCIFKIFLMLINSVSVTCATDIGLLLSGPQQRNTTDSNDEH